MSMKNWKRNLAIAALVAFILAGPVGFVVTHSVYSFVLMGIGWGIFALAPAFMDKRKPSSTNDAWVHGYRYDYSYDPNQRTK